VARVDDVGLDRVIVHDAHADDPSAQFALSRLSDPTTLASTPVGVFRAVQRPAYDDLLDAQVQQQTVRTGPGDLATLLRGRDTWTI
jgi:2-oxoglutarate ferredoxin oxidoreductase subunit beta